MFQGYAPDTDLDKIRDRFVGILIGLAVTAVIFHYLWPERSRMKS
jgi:multidrug resistance protein MdtO